MAKKRSGDTILVISALLIAYFIWLVAKMGNIEETVVDRVAVKVAAPSYIEATPSLDNVSIEVRYPKGQRKDIHSRAFQVLINDPDILTEAGVEQPRAVNVPLLPSDVKRPSLPPTVQVVRVEPSRMTIFVRFRTAKARVVPRLVGQPAAGYHVEKVLVRQPERLLAGPRELLDSLPRNEKAEVELPTTPPLSIDGLSASTKTIVAIHVPEGLNLLVQDGKPRLLRDVAFALVQVIIKEQQTTRTIAGVPIHVPTLARNLVAQTEPTSASVTIVGPRSVVRAFDPKAIKLRPKNPPEERPDFVGKIAIEPYTERPLPRDVRIVGVRPNVVLLRYETVEVEPKTTPTLAP